MEMSSFTLAGLPATAMVPAGFDTVLLALQSAATPWLDEALVNALAGALGGTLAAAPAAVEGLDVAARTALLQSESAALARRGFRYVLVLSESCFCGVNFGAVQRSLWEQELETSVLLYAPGDSAWEKAQAVGLPAAMAEDIRASVLYRR